ncbi:MAG TPA: hypothetical protein VFA51_12750 [Candidatus Udaeobacter sp.]|nr:hypothetical protein [Candidatus Udaeobacter sp.]
MKTAALAVIRRFPKLAYAAVAVGVLVLPVGFAFARGGHGGGGGGHGGGGHFGGGGGHFGGGHFGGSAHIGGVGHVGGAHFGGGHAVGVGRIGGGYPHVGGVGYVGGGHAIGRSFGYLGRSPRGYIGGSHITSTQHFGSRHAGQRGQFNGSGARRITSGSRYFNGVGTPARTHALSNHNFVATNHHTGINADHHHHDRFHHHHNSFFFYPFAFGAFYSAYPYYSGYYPYTYGSPYYGYGGDPCDPYSSYYDPAYCDWLYWQGYYGNGSMYQSAPSTLPPQQNSYPLQQWNAANNSVVSATTNPSTTIALQTLVNQSESAQDVDLDDAPAEYTAAIRAPLVAATSAPDALPPQSGQSK